MKKYYEDTYKNSKHFSFGKNWQDFLRSLDEERIEKAKKSLVDFLGGEERIKDKTFVDIGCGSGLFSLAAYLLGASRIVSTDVDEFSIACTKYLRESNGSNSQNWEIKQGSALNQDFIKSLGQFDIIYSWGVLHHTGDMYKAFENVTNLMSPRSVFYLAIYNRNDNVLIGTSNFWLKVKRLYNNSGTLGKKGLLYLYYIYFFLDSIIALRNPIKKIINFKRRGMNWKNNVLDWLGGYPYEFANPEEIVDYFSSKSIYCKKIRNYFGLACAEYLLEKVNKEV